jgi:2-C-methyl-D-erythritol 2,4-cyclodiphosphate synthase
MKVRVGFGYDVHRLVDGLPLALGGITIEHNKGSLGHSDGDVLIHAICDALLGAANLRDIGYHFPDTSAELKGIDSKILLQKTWKLLKERSYELQNIDATICLQVPKINPLIPEMKDTLAQVLEVSADAISIKATTTEKMGFVGTEEGISAYAAVLIGSSE